ncbi:MAG: septal ring lytic transglycosylase RlpA family protein [Melioribacteraceae bacterium]
MDNINSAIKKLLILLLLIVVISCSSTKQITKIENKNKKGNLIESGIASWYGPNFNGKLTANGETFDMYDLTAAHRTLPFNSIVKAINKSNGQSVVVRINDRGPYAKSRIIDLSKKAAEKIGMIKKGFTEVDLILLSKSTLPTDLKVPHFTVQIGSYNKKSDAIKVSSTIEETKVVSAIVNGQTYYRIYVGVFTDRNKAETKKIFLLENGIDGFVKQIEN